MDKKFRRRSIWVTGPEEKALTRMARGFGISVETYLHMIVFDSATPRPMIKVANQNVNVKTGRRQICR